MEELIDFDLFYNDDIFAEDCFNGDNTNASLTQIMGISTQELIKTEPSDAIENGRFAAPVSTEQLRDKHDDAIPKKTRQNNNWAVALWKEWAANRNQTVVTALEPGSPIPLNVTDMKDFSLLDYWLQRFIIEIRRKDGQPYPGNTLIQIASALQRHLRSNSNFKDVNLFKMDDSTFAEFRKTLDARMKELVAMGIGVKKTSSDPVTVEDEMSFWNAGVFNMMTSEGLSNAVFFYNGKTFGFRGFQEHIDCQADQFELGYDNANKVNFIRFTPRIRKNAQGGLKHRNLSIEPITQYDTVSNSNSVYKIYEKYLNLIPRIGPFYRKPLGTVDENNNIRFSSGVISQNSIRQMLKRFFNEANVNMDGRKITNHSARVTLCTSLYNEKFTDKAVTSRSHHRSNAVHTYQRENFKTLSDISNVLDAPALANKTDTLKTVGITPFKTEPIERDALKTEENEPPKTESSFELASAEDLTQMEEKKENDSDCLTIGVPKCVKRIVLLKEGKKIAIDV